MVEYIFIRNMHTININAKKYLFLIISIPSFINVYNIALKMLKIITQCLKLTKRNMIILREYKHALILIPTTC